MLTIPSRAYDYSVTIVRYGGFVNTYMLTEIKDTIEAINFAAHMLKEDNVSHIRINETITTEYLVTPEIRSNEMP